MLLVRLYRLRQRAKSGNLRPIIPTAPDGHPLSAFLEPGVTRCVPVFDVETMTIRHTTAAVSVALLVVLSGCSSGPSSYAQAKAEQSGGRAGAQNQRNAHEVVVGAVYNADGVPVYKTPVSALTLDQIAAELTAMRNLDQELVRESTGAPLAASEISRIRAIDRAHAARLSQIVDAIGWPTRELVGMEAAQGAFVVVQHAGHAPDLQNRCLALMVDQVEKGKLPAPYVALLTDRVRLFADQPQVFGTQMTFVTGDDGIARCVPAIAIEDPANLNARRDLMGLPPHDGFIAQLEQAYRTQHGGAFASVLVE